MKKKCTLMVVASLGLTTTNAPVVCAQGAGGIKAFLTIVLPITGVSVPTDSNCTNEKSQRVLLYGQNGNFQKVAVK